MPTSVHRTLNGALQGDLHKATGTSPDKKVPDAKVEAAKSSSNSHIADVAKMYSGMSSDIEDRRNEGTLGKVKDFATGIVAQGKSDYADGKTRDNPVDPNFYKPGQDAASTGGATTTGAQ